MMDEQPGNRVVRAAQPVKKSDAGEKLPLHQ